METAMADFRDDSTHQPIDDRKAKTTLDADPTADKETASMTFLPGSQSPIGGYRIMPT
jgi:hypothetical protein